MILVFRAIWLVRYLGLFNNIHPLARDNVCAGCFSNFCRQRSFERIIVNWTPWLQSNLHWLLLRHNGNLSRPQRTFDTLFKTSINIRACKNFAVYRPRKDILFKTKNDKFDTLFKTKVPKNIPWLAARPH